MPLLDHFHPPLSPSRHWESFHTAWAGSMADALNERLLPENYFAEEHAHAGDRVEIDVATFEESAALSSSRGEGGTATLRPQVWLPPAPTMAMPAVFPEHVQVLIFKNEGGAALVAAIELVSPSNKDRSEHRRAFATKCASYLYQGISLVLVDIVTSREANLHNDLVELIQNGAAFLLTPAPPLYAVGYRPLRREEKEQIDIWPAALCLGKSLPVIPLALSPELAVPLDLEATYVDACRRRRLI